MRLRLAWAALLISILPLIAAVVRGVDFPVDIKARSGGAVADFLDVVGVGAAGCEFFEVSRHKGREGRRLIVFAESSQGRSGCDVDIVSVTVDGGAVLLEVHKKADAAR